MCQIHNVLFYWSSMWLLCLHTTLPQQVVPPIACPKYFQYLYYDNHYIGRLTLPNLSPYEIELEVGFTQRESVSNGYFGSVSLFNDKEYTNFSLINRLPISFRVDFPLPTVPPKLTKIVVSKELLCQAADYPPPSIRFSLPFKFVSGTKPFMDFEPVPLNIIHSMQANSVAVAPVSTNLPLTTAITPVMNADYSCGSNAGHFIHGGNNLPRGQFPWMAAIFNRKPGSLKFICGGSLVSARSVITAGNCFKADNLNAKDIVVYLGLYDLNKHDEDGALVRDVRRLHIKPDSTETFPEADLAILELNKPVEFNWYIRPICLWKEAANINLILGQIAHNAGWGLNNVRSNVPKYMNGSFITTTDCEDAEPNLFAYEFVSSKTLCASTSHWTGPCAGDVGSGLVTMHNGRWTLRGVLSTCQPAADGSPKVFTICSDLAVHRAWVEEHLV